MRERKDLVKIVNFCRKYGVKSIKTADLELVLFDKPPTKVGELGSEPTKFAVSPNADAESAAMPSDDELLFFATDHFETLHADKRDVK